MSDLFDYITEVCAANIDISICIPKGLLRTKVEESFGEALTLKEQSRMLEIYRIIPESVLVKMIIPENLYCDLHLHMEIDILNEKEDLNSLLYTRIQHNIWKYYCSVPLSEKNETRVLYNRIFKRLSSPEKNETFMKIFILVISIIGGILMYLTRDNVGALYAIAGGLGSILAGAAIYVVYLSFRREVN